MKLAELIQQLSDQRIQLDATHRGTWKPLWRILSVRTVNGNPIVTNRPY